ncbi:DNA-directed RNA polymerase subunit omega [Candidatus Saganbacteria bacterium]|nr:DNA-directed RNA polymerase subunit omega [Candidatus Saganbacteria bacterium]
MTTKETIDILLKNAKNKFLLSNAVAGRAKQITEGSLPYVNDFDPTNPIITAIREIARDKIRIKLLTAESKKPVEIKMVEPEEPNALEKLAKGSKKETKKKKA